MADLTLIPEHGHPDHDAKQHTLHFRSFGKDPVVDALLKELTASDSRKLSSVMKKGVEKSEQARLSRMGTEQKLPTSSPGLNKVKSLPISKSAAPEDKNDNTANAKILLRKGYLEKQGKSFKSWKVRYFHLYMRPRQFMYFEDIEAVSRSQARKTVFGTVRSKKKTETMHSPKISFDFTTADKLVMEADVFESGSTILPEFHKHLVQDPGVDLKDDAIKMISLADDGIVVKKLNSFGIEIKTKSRVWQFRATSKENQEEWLKAFEFVASGKSEKFIEQVEALENVIRVLRLIIKFNKTEADTVGWLSSRDANFILSKIESLKTMKRFFDEDLEVIADLDPIRMDAQAAIIQATFAANAILIRTELHEAVSEFDYRVEVLKKLLVEIDSGNTHAREAAEEVWEGARKLAVAILGNDKFENMIEGSAREDCRYLDDRAIFEKKYKAIDEEMRTKLKKAKKLGSKMSRDT